MEQSKKLRFDKQKIKKHTASAFFGKKDGKIKTETY